MDSKDQPSGAAPEGKKPYDPPRIVSREPLEAVAAVCSPPGKANPGLCPSGPFAS